MFGDKSYSILLWSILGYLCIRKNVKEMNGDEIPLPPICITILFPFLRAKKVSLLLSIIAAYLEIGLVVVYGMHFMAGRTWEWMDISSVWLFTLFLVSLIGGIVEFVFLAVKSQKQSGWVTTVLYWGAAVLIFMFTLFYVKEIFIKYIVII